MENNVHMSQARLSAENMRHNFQTFRQHIGADTKLLAVLKADAYGHGAISFAKRIAREQLAEHLGVAQLVEAVSLREAGIQLPILIFGPTTSEQLYTAIKYKITLPVFTVEQARDIVATADKLGEDVTVHLKVDSGMNRIGVKSSQAALEVFNLLKRSDHVDVQGIFTHFADAEEQPANDFTRQQFQTFIDCAEAIEDTGHHFELKHCANTAATINFPEYHLDMVRVGIGLYGYYPNEKMSDTTDVILKPVMETRARITNLKTVRPGETISYGRTYTPEKETEHIATVAIGYADGMERKLSNRGQLTVRQQLVPIVGRVCMDQVMINVSKLQNSKGLIDGWAIFFGDYISDPSVPSLFDVARAGDSFHYELLCRVGPRMERLWVDSLTSGDTQ